MKCDHCGKPTEVHDDRHTMSSDGRYAYIHGDGWFTCSGDRGLAIGQQAHIATVNGDTSAPLGIGPDQQKDGDS